MRCILLLSLIALYQPAHAIKGGEAVSIGGILQWIQYEGVNPAAPVLLFIHGGPGNSAIRYADRFTSRLKQNYVVVFWDQRASGKTASLQRVSEPLRADQFVSDAIAVVEYLCSRFDQKKIFVAGHSWGGYLGLRVAQSKPELVRGLFAISPMIHQLRSEQLSLDLMLAHAAKESNATAQAELSQVKIPFETGTQLYFHRKWLNVLQQTGSLKQSRVEQWATTWLTVFNEASRVNLMETAPAIGCPVYFLIGRQDYQTHFSLAEQYYQQLVCENKKLVWFKRSAHTPHLTETAAFEDVILAAAKIETNE